MKAAFEYRYVQSQSHESLISEANLLAGENWRMIDVERFETRSMPHPVWVGFFERMAPDYEPFRAAAEALGRAHEAQTPVPESPSASPTE